MKRTPVQQPEKARKRARSFKVDDRVLDAPRYDFEPIIETDRELAKYAITVNGHRSVDFSSREATFHLTRGILKHYFNIEFSLPPGHLVPTIPNRVQYLKWAAGLLPGECRKQNVVVLDIGTGPSCIYPILGVRLFPHWEFIATDIDEQAVQSARHNCEVNELDNIAILKTESEDKLFCDRVRRRKPLLTVCNPPFHARPHSGDDPPGTDSQLLTSGGEYSFLCKLAEESVLQHSVMWFTSLIGCKEDLPRVVSFLRSPQIRATRIKSAELCPGGRTTRWAVAWSFGEQSTKAILQTDATSKWRYTIIISPGRKFGNQLEEHDIEGVVRFSMCSMDWYFSEDNRRTEQTSKRSFRGADSSMFEACEMETFVRREQSSFDFAVLLKVQQRGRLQAANFKEVCVTLKEKILTFLKQLESSS
ncbi:RNA methyltransferase [Gracilaria domingensis]|nr:RNA methyltransferase [Gracilaria domingensis]